MNIILEVLALQKEIEEIKKMMLSIASIKSNNIEVQVSNIPIEKYNIPEMELDMIKKVIIKFPTSKRNYRSAQARALGLPERSYYRKLKKYNLYEQ